MAPWITRGVRSGDRVTVCPAPEVAFGKASPSTTDLHQNAKQNPFGNSVSLKFDEETATKADPNSSNYAQLNKKLNKGNIKGCKISEEANRRKRAAEIRRKERPGPPTNSCSRRAFKTSCTRSIRIWSASLL